MGAVAAFARQVVIEPQQLHPGDRVEVMWWNGDRVPGTVIKVGKTGDGLPMLQIDADTTVSETSTAMDFELVKDPDESPVVDEETALPFPGNEVVWFTVGSEWVLVFKEESE